MNVPNKILKCPEFIYAQAEVINLGEDIIPSSPGEQVFTLVTALPTGDTPVLLSDADTSYSYNARIAHNEIITLPILRGRLKACLVFNSNGLPNMTCFVNNQ